MRVVLLTVLMLVSGLSFAQNAEPPGRQKDSGTVQNGPREKELQGQDAQSVSPQDAVTDLFSRSKRPSLEKSIVPNILADQKAFWTRPFQPRSTDIKWLVPFVASTSLMIGSDNSIGARVSTGSTRVKRSQELSNLGAASLIGTAGGFYLLGQVTHNDHARETGLLSGEALVNSLAVGSAIQVFAGRQRPTEGNGKGKFWQGGTSFPSDHAAAAWSVASVLAHEYPGPMTKLLAYGAASAVSIARITGQKHFAADVFVGSALGWYFGREVYRKHHDPELGGPGWEVSSNAGDEPRAPANMGSPSVPLDSWVYPAIERLAALGYVRTAYLGIRPWTRMECARLLEEAGERIGDGNTENNEVNPLYSALVGEFADESARWNGASNLGASVDSVYTRFTGISGTPLRDSYHFGQSIINDYGRPYGEGFNPLQGFTSHAVAGPLSITVQGEYQHAPAVLSDAPSVLQATAAADGTLPLPNGTAQIDRFRLLESTIALTFNNVQFSFGQQSLWLGPSESGPFLFSNNAEPMTMLRIESVSPYSVPVLSRLLGPVRSQFFLGRLSGQRWEESPTLFGPNLTSQPFVHGTSVSFHPTSNLEFGFGYTAQFGGQGNPFTWSNFLRTFYSHRANSVTNPAKRLSEFHFSYRLPGLRDWLQVYVDSMVIDEYSPIGSTRPAINPGLYFPRLPRMHKMELRLEGVTTDLNWSPHFSPGTFYADGRYRSGYTNNGNIIGSWIGRQGRGQQAWLTYRFSPRTYIEAGYRHNSVDRNFLNGGQLRDFTLRADVMLAKQWSISGFVQQENWHFPVLSPTSKSDVAASLQLTFWPHWKTRQK
ncbi:MAG: phosphatase PAP2 family protein [Acidobacteriia bacterium]|nr:phosphatase PAP2 family protein [Terriglobia bacterium]